MVNVDDRNPDLGQKVPGKNLHVTGQHYEVDVAPQQLKDLLLSPGLIRTLLRWHVEEGDTEGAHVLGRVRVVGNHHGNADRQLTTTTTPQQIQQAVVLFRSQDRHALGNRLITQFPVQPERAQSRVDILAKSGHCNSEARLVEDHSLEKLPTASFICVLVEGDNIAPVASKHAGNSGNDSSGVWTVNRQTSVILGEGKR